MTSATTAQLNAEIAARKAADVTNATAIAAEGKARLAGDKLNADAIAALAARVAVLETPIITPLVIVPAPYPLNLQAAIDSAVPGAVIDVTGGPVYRPVKFSKPITLKGAEIAGSGSGAYIEGENGIWAYGSTAAPLVGLSIIGCHIHGVGKTGVLIEHASAFQIDANTLEDCTYAGIIVFSGITGSVDGNTVRRIGYTVPPAQLPEGSNSYGIMVNDQGLPASADIVLSNNIIEDVPNWHVLDTHGGLRISFINNIVRRCRRGLFITSSPASGAHATGIVVAGNQILSPSPLTDPTTAVTLYEVVGATFTGNTITGWGPNSPTSAQPWFDFQDQSTGLVNGGGNVVTT